VYCATSIRPHLVPEEGILIWMLEEGRLGVSAGVKTVLNHAIGVED
jgi:hypothetical protein